MTPRALENALIDLRYTNAQFADACQVRLRTVEHWLSGRYPVPLAIERWIERALQWQADNPVPGKEDTET